MNFAFTEEQQELRATARAFLAAYAGSEPVRAAMESPLGHDPALWKRIAGELGWPAVAIPEAYGGIGLGFVELVALFEVAGEALLCSPLFASAALGAPAILCAGTEAQKQALLPPIAEGSCIATLALAEASGRWDAEGVAATWRRDGAGYRLDGVKRHVVDGHCAHLLVVAARAEGTAGDGGISLFAVPAEAAGVSRTALPTVDQTRRLAEVTLSGVTVAQSARLGEAGAAAPALAKALALANVALAAEQVGGAQRCLDLAVAYAKERVQFGRPIGSFQAIKNKCADMLVKLEAARSAVYYAGCVAAEDSEALPEASAMAKAAASDAYTFCAGNALQIFGGVGFTWEYDVHLYFKRARASAALLGDPSVQRERVAQRIGL
jgi:alkylation response protein AidB-like acyl-CoA dehydrogenase